MLSTSRFLAILGGEPWELGRGREPTMRDENEKMSVLISNFLYYYVDLPICRSCPTCIQRQPLFLCLDTIGTSERHQADKVR